MAPGSNVCARSLRGHCRIRPPAPSGRLSWIKSVRNSMRERLVEDWLIRINERGYDVAFCQILLLQGRHVLRAGHSPIEHGKDVLAASVDRKKVWGYQLKTGNVSQADV